MANLNCWDAELQCPPDVAVHCALRTNCRGGAQLYQLCDFLVEWAGAPHRRPQGFDRMNVIGMLVLSCR